MTERETLLLEIEYLSQRVFIKLIGERKSVEKEMNHFRTSPTPVSYPRYSSYLPAPTTDNIEQQAHGSQTHIKRPLNPFIIWSCERRKIIAKENLEMDDNIMKQLGEEWKNLPPEEKQIFIKKSSQLRKEHKKQYPHYKYYWPRKKIKYKNLVEYKPELVPTNNHSSGHPNNFDVDFINDCRFFSSTCSQCSMPTCVPMTPYYSNIQHPLQGSSLPLANHSATEPDTTFMTVNTGATQMMSPVNQGYDPEPHCPNCPLANRSL